MPYIHYPMPEKAVYGFYEQPLDSDYAYDSIRGQWSNAERYGIGFRHFGTPSPSKAATTWGGGMVAWDTRKGTINGGGKIEVDTLLFLAEGGIAANLLPREKKDRVTLEPALTIRGGLGFQDGRISNYPTALGPASGDLAPMRLEFGAGGEVTMTLSRKIYLLAGAGVTWFLGSESVGVAAGTGGASVGISAHYVGFETYGRIGAGVRF